MVGCLFIYCDKFEIEGARDVLNLKGWAIDNLVYF